MKEKCYYHYIIKDTIKPPLSQERWEVFSLFFKKSPPKEQAFVRLSHPDRGKGPAHRTPGRGRPWTPPHSQAKGREPPLSPFRLLGCWCGCPRAWVASLRVSITLSVPLPGPVRQQARAAARKKTQRAPHTFPPQPTRPAGHASQSFPARRRGKKMRSCFDRLRRPKHTAQPPVCPQGARSGCIPQFWEGPHTKQNT